MLEGEQVNLAESATPEPTSKAQSVRLLSRIRGSAPALRNLFTRVKDVVRPKTGPIADNLRRYVDEDKLSRNTEHYEELQRELTGEEQRQVGLIRDVLLGVPLVHATSRHDADPAKPLLPAREITYPGRVNTFRLDRSLGLDEYTFFHWGFPFTKGAYGAIFMLVDPHLLLDQRTVVYPSRYI